MRINLADLYSSAYCIHTSAPQTALDRDLQAIEHERRFMAPPPSRSGWGSPASAFAAALASLIVLAGHRWH